jgi:hypothetical protein
MDPKPRHQPVRLGHARLQQDDQDPDGDNPGRPVPQGWVAEYDNTEADERLNRLLADAELVSRLQWHNFAGPQWEVFATELARYGVAVLRGWLRTGVIFEKVRSVGWGGLPAPPLDAMDEHAIESLADETVVIALNKFRTDVLMQHRWKHEQGATLKTFFIGQCLIRFPNVYRSWEAKEREHRRRHLAVGDELLLQLVGGEWYEDVEDLIIVRMDSSASLHDDVPDQRTRTALVLMAAGYTQQEIAERLGVTEKTIEMLVYRQRRRIEKRQGIA